MMRKEILATLLISLIWIAAGIAVAYSAWYSVVQQMYPNYYREPLPDPYLLGALLFSGALLLTFVIIRTILPSRATQRRKLLRLLDDVGIEDVETIQRKLNALSDDYGSDTTDPAASLESLLREQKRKNQA